MPAFQDAGHAFQGTGQFAFQVGSGTRPLTGTKSEGRKRHRRRHEYVLVLPVEPPTRQKLTYLWRQYVENEPYRPPPKVINLVRPQQPMPLPQPTAVVHTRVELLPPLDAMPAKQEWVDQVVAAWRTEYERIKAEEQHKERQRRNRRALAILMMLTM